MKAAIIALSAILVLAGCGKPQPAPTEDNVVRLFTVDGCTVYRFYDNGYSRYFTNCSGSTQWSESSGKNSSRLVTVDGGAK